MIGTFFRQECGASAVEYGMLIALIAAVVCATIGGLGISVMGLYDRTFGAIPK